MKRLPNIMLVLTALVATIPTLTAGRDLAQEVVQRLGEIEGPIKKHAPLPVYPRGQEAEGNSGRVEVEAVIKEDGQVYCPRLVVSKLEPPMAYTALTTMAEWRSKPARRAGQPISVYFDLTINFRLR